MREIDVTRGHDLRTMARLLADRSIPGPLYLHDGDGERLAVMIRAEAWDPRLDRFVFIDGRYRCDTCRRAGTGHALPAGVPLDVLSKAANAHWREAHQPARVVPQGEPGGIPLTKVDAVRTDTGPVKNMTDAQERMHVMYGCTFLRPMRSPVGWWGNGGGGEGTYYLLKDGRSDGPFAGDHAAKEAARKAAQGGTDGTA